MEQKKRIESTLDIDPVMGQLQQEAFGARVTFKAVLSDHKHLDGRRAVLTRHVMYPSDGDGGYDEEALPFFRLLFADGIELDACESEVVTDDEAAEALIAGVCAVFSHARGLGYTGPGHLEEEGTAEHGRAYVDLLRVLPRTRAALNHDIASQQ